MASRPDYLKTYEAQSFPVEMDRTSPFVPPADYPMEEFVLRPKKPWSPPLGYRKREKYPFRTYGDGATQRHSEIVRTTAEANQFYSSTIPPPPDYPAPRQDQLQYSSSMHPRSEQSQILRRHTVHGSASPPMRPRAGSGLNKAFLHHLKNYNKFATVKGREACCDGCPICKAIAAANDVLEDDSQEIPGQKWPKNYPLATNAPVTLLQDAVDDPEAYQKERRQQAFLRDLTRRGVKAARVVADRVARHVRELTVTKGEYLEIFDDTTRWWACSNVSGQLGYVPSNILVSV